MSKRLDRIHIRDLQARCIIGIYPDERVNKQDVIVNITLYADLDAASHSDRLEDTVDYKDMKKRILAAVEDSSFYLVERLAGHLAEICLADPAVEKVDVTVDKPGALRFARSVAIEVTRERGSDG